MPSLKVCLALLSCGLAWSSPQPRVVERSVHTCQFEPGSAPDDRQPIAEAEYLADHKLQALRDRTFEQATAARGPRWESTLRNTWQDWRRLDGQYRTADAVVQDHVVCTRAALAFLLGDADSAAITYGLTCLKSKRLQDFDGFVRVAVARMVRMLFDEDDVDLPQPIEVVVEGGQPGTVLRLDFSGDHLPRREQGFHVLVPVKNREPRFVFLSSGEWRLRPAQASGKPLAGETADCRFPVSGWTRLVVRLAGLTGKSVAAP